jgi:hypothetical protein
MFLLLGWQILLSGAVFDNCSPFYHHGQGIILIEFLLRVIGNCLPSRSSFLESVTMIIRYCSRQALGEKRKDGSGRDGTGTPTSYLE